MPRLPIESNSGTHVVMHGREYLAFGGCSYLGLTNNPQVHAALVAQLSISGISTTASRETTGNTVVHDALEVEVAAFLGLPAALLLTEGYTANFAMAQGVRAHGIAVAVMDSKSHRSLGHACAASGIRIELFDHLDAAHAARLARQHASEGVAIMTDTVFAADGSVAPLPDLLAALPQDPRALLVIDDCHGLGVLGSCGRGSANHFNLVGDPRLIVTGTLGKGMGCYGGFLAGTTSTIDAFRAAAGIYKGTTPVPVPLAAAARAALRIAASTPSLVERLHDNTLRTQRWLARIGVEPQPIPVPIFTFWRTPASVMEAAYAALLDRGILVPLIDYPNGPTDRYFRLSVTAAHTPEQIDTLGHALTEVLT